MNQSTYIKCLTHTNRAYFYDLYIKNEVGSERDNFHRRFVDDDQINIIDKIRERLEAPSADVEETLREDFFRMESYKDRAFVAIPGRSNDANKLPKGIALRLFCYKPTDKTLIYLNGYKHSNRLKRSNIGEAWQDTEFRQKGQQIFHIMSALKIAEEHGRIEYGVNGAIYMLYENNKILVSELDLTEYLS